MSELFLYGVLLLPLGLLQAVWPYKLARFSEQMDSIGSKRRWSEVEPADWKVLLTRVIGVLLVLFSGGAILAG